MKKVFGTLMIGASLVLVSCGGSAETEETVAVEEVTYNLDTENSTIAWHAGENEQHFHDGVVKFSEGSVVMAGDDIVSGTFEVDMNTIQAQTEGYPEEKLGYLTGHLKDTSIFFVAEHPVVTVTINGYSEGKISTTTTVLGVDLKNDFPVKVESTEEGVHITGDISMDMSAANIQYVNAINEETGKPNVNPVFDYKIDLHLKK